MGPWRTRVWKTRHGWWRYRIYLATDASLGGDGYRSEHRARHGLEEALREGNMAGMSRLQHIRNRVNKANTNIAGGIDDVWNARYADDVAWLLAHVGPERPTRDDAGDPDSEHDHPCPCGQYWESQCICN
jgi:hypothetical protein